MTNEEKAKEIATWPLQRDEEFLMCYACVLEMAAWKDQQMIDIFERFVNKKFHKIDAEMLIRDFKKAMKGE